MTRVKLERQIKRDLRRYNYAQKQILYWRKISDLISRELRPAQGELLQLNSAVEPAGD